MFVRHDEHLLSVPIQSDSKKPRSWSFTDLVVHEVLQFHNSQLVTFVVKAHTADT
jgi:hypothetical protein